MNHAPEPWEIDDKDNEVVRSDAGLWPQCPGPATAARIVACVNACRGIPTEMLVGADQQLETQKRAITGHLVNKPPVMLGGAKRCDFPYYEENT